MVRHKLFLKWWLVVILVLVGVGAAFYMQAFQKIWERDLTKLSFVIFGIFIYISAWCGVKTFKLSNVLNKGIPQMPAKNLPKPQQKRQQNRRKKWEDEVKKLTRLEEIGWFSSEMCVNIGMIGTVSGFILMLVGFSTLDVSDVTSVQDLLSSMSGGMSTALYTTLIGLICSQLLKIQYFNLSQGLNLVKKELQ